MKKAVRFGLISALLLQMSAITTNAQQMKVDDTFVEYNLRWSNSAGGWKAMWRPIEMGNVIGICGVGAYWGHSSRDLSKRAIRDLSITLDGNRLVKDLRYFATVRSRDDLTSAMANCKASAIPVTAFGQGSQFGFETSRRLYRD